MTSTTSITIRCSAQDGLELQQALTARLTPEQVTGFELSDDGADATITFRTTEDSVPEIRSIVGTRGQVSHGR